MLGALGEMKYDRIAFPSSDSGSVAGIPWGAPGVPMGLPLASDWFPLSVTVSFLLPRFPFRIKFFYNWSVSVVYLLSIFSMVPVAFVIWEPWIPWSENSMKFWMYLSSTGYYDLKQYKLNAYYHIFQSWLCYIPGCSNLFGRCCKSVKNKMFKNVISSGSGPKTMGVHRVPDS